MTALSSNYQNYARKDGVLVAEPINTATTANTIYVGSLLNRGATHKGVQAASNTTGEQFAGVASDYAVGAAGSAAIGTLTVLTYKTGIFRMETASGAGANDPDAVAATDLGAVVYVVDSISVGKSGGDGSTCYVACGILEKYVSATEVYVRIDGYAK